MKYTRNYYIRISREKLTKKGSSSFDNRLYASIHSNDPLVPKLLTHFELGTYYEGSEEYNFLYQIMKCIADRMTSYLNDEKVNGSIVQINRIYPINEVVYEVLYIR